jgi:hypothetical protein
MKTIFTFSFAVIFYLSFTTRMEAQNEPVLTLVTSLNPQGATEMLFHPTGEIQVDYWSKDLVEIQIYIEDESFSRQQLKALVPIGFYKFESDLKASTLNVFMPNQNRAITINGRQVNNSLKFRIKIPNNLLVKYPETGTNTPGESLLKTS